MNPEPDITHNLDYCKGYLLMMAFNWTYRDALTSNCKRNRTLWKYSWTSSGAFVNLSYVGRSGSLIISKSPSIDCSKYSLSTILPRSRGSPGSTAGPPRFGSPRKCSVIHNLLLYGLPRNKPEERGATAFSPPRTIDSLRLCCMRSGPVLPDGLVQTLFYLYIWLKQVHSVFLKKWAHTVFYDR